LVDEARARVALLLGARESEIIFTSGGTEADNMALRGVLAADPGKRHVIVSAIEHHAVLETAEVLERQGIEVTLAPVDSDGLLDLTALENALRDDTALVAVMLANNETGVIQPVRKVVEIAQRRRVPVHCDAVQAIGKMPVRVEDLGVDLLALSAHKFYGPKGAGALYVRSGLPMRPMMIGGHQERGRRGGTHNTAGIVGLGMACELAARAPEGEVASLREMRDRLERGVQERFEQALIVGRNAPRLANTACICFAGLEAQMLLMMLNERGICASGGAACSSGSLTSSHVLAAMGIDPEAAQGQVRFSLGRENVAEDVEHVLTELESILGKLASFDAA
jgi:cysteine desulfurase